MPHELELVMRSEAIAPVPVQVALTVKEAGNPEGGLVCGQGGVVESIDACTDADCRLLAKVNADAGMTKHPPVKPNGPDSKMFRSVSCRVVEGAPSGFDVLVKVVTNMVIGGSVGSA